MEQPWFPRGFDTRRHHVDNGMHVDAILTALAGLQHGVVSARQALWLGISRGRLRNRLHSGHLQGAASGIYLVGRPAPTPAGRAMTGVLAGGPSTFIGDLTAAAHLGARVRLPPRVHLVVPPGKRIERPGMVSRDAVVLPHERTLAAGIPSLTMARVMLDVAAHRDRRTTEDLWHDSVYRKLLPEGSIERALADHAGEPGIVMVRELHDRRRTAIGDVANRFEAAMRDIVVEAGMPEPRANMPLYIGGHRLRPDLYIPERGIALESDGRDGHADPEQQLSDATRDRLYRSIGLVVARYGWWAVTYERWRVVDELRRYEAAWQACSGTWTPAHLAPMLGARRRSE